MTNIKVITGISAIAIALLGVAIQPQKSMAATVSKTLPAVQDSYDSFIASGNNYGTQDYLYVGFDAGIPWYSRSYVQFDLGEIPAGSVVTSATLKLTPLTPPIHGGTLPAVMQVTAADADWTENALTWNNHPTPLTVPVANGAVDATTNAESFDVTNIVTQWVAGVTMNHGFVLTSPGSGSAYYVTFSAREGSAAPQLAITYTEPDLVGPKITHVAVTATQTEATITWSTDEKGTSYIDYGTSNSYGKTKGTSALVAAHSVVLGDLAPNTNYTFRIRTADADGHESVSGERVFTTPAAATTETTTPTADAGTGLPNTVATPVVVLAKNAAQSPVPFFTTPAGKIVFGFIVGILILAAVIVGAFHQRITNYFARRQKHRE